MLCAVKRARRLEVASVAPATLGRDDDSGHLPQRMDRRRGLPLDHVQARARDATRPDEVRQRDLVDEATACHVDHHGPLRQEVQPAPVEDVTRRCVVRHVERDEVRLRQQVIEPVHALEQAHTVPAAELRVGSTPPDGDDAHAHRRGTGSEGACARSEPDQQDRATDQLSPGRGMQGGRPDESLELREATQHEHREHQRVLRQATGARRARAVRDRQPSPRQRCHVDRVVAHGTQLPQADVASRGGSEFGGGLHLVVHDDIDRRVGHLVRHGTPRVHEPDVMRTTDRGHHVPAPGQSAGDAGPPR